MTMSPAVQAWLLGNDTGLSSKAIVAFMEGRPPGFWGYDHPRDDGDLGRCLRLLAIAPEYRGRLYEIAAVSPYWAALVPAWGELETLYYQGLGVPGISKCYLRMREILEPVEQKSRK